MGRHSALEGAAVDPVVAAALAQRAADAPAGRHGDPRAEGTEGGLGWPGTSTTHEGLGWPGGMTDEVAPAAPPQRERRGWRRLFRAA
ncbi:hypothetical protein [Geodermatophilus sp. URMC 60]